MQLMQIVDQNQDGVLWLLDDLTAEIDADQQTNIRSCSHVWPGDLAAEAACNICGLPYGDWSQ